jgi:hypothetical protein
MRSVSRRLEGAAIRWGGGAPRARPELWISRGACRRRCDLRRPGRRVDGRCAGHRTHHARPRRSPAYDLPRGGTERGARPREGRGAATAALRRSTRPAAASPLAPPARLRALSYCSRTAALPALVAAASRASSSPHPRTPAAASHGKEQRAPGVDVDARAAPFRAGKDRARVPSARVPSGHHAGSLWLVARLGRAIPRRWRRASGPA